MNKKTIIEELVKRYNNTETSQTESLSSWLASQLELIDNILWGIQSINKKRLEAKRTYHESLLAIDKEEMDIQKKCLHLDSTYHSDPSGGSDSFSQCNICGKQWEKRLGELTDEV